MSERPHITYRKLGQREAGLVKAHLLRLDEESRRRRFFGHVADVVIEDYCGNVLSTAYPILGCFVDGVLRGVAELRPYGASDTHKAEVAVSVEREFQGQGIGTELVRALIVLARNRSIRVLYMSCLRENGAMQAIARKLGGALDFHESEVAARITPPWPTYWSLMEEAFADGRAVMHTLVLGQRHAAPASDAA
ncbi:MAG: GNAT family N-acetyltransferase [Alphaproteobacteria bacterium]